MSTWVEMIEDAFMSDPTISAVQPYPYLLIVEAMILQPLVAQQSIRFQIRVHLLLIAAHVLQQRRFGVQQTLAGLVKVARYPNG